ncbi:uncharacterized protein KY384_008344 [Bacidia gigantensis]|uniref:uncharacterized protein n=1 Tax=Bacidia gigantensis TaxID=2732470 RepID=UPI001D0364B0|nr:uncharacterized protein KY384_008344 [Bacidia gigantensis]KAG8526915.1 hypothetical protein KY384_008344 [Bacidia gigantensis]
MPPITPTVSGSTTNSSHGRQQSVEISHPFVYKYGRRYLREIPEYPLPVDLAELHRQTLRTTLLLDVFGTPFSSRLGHPPEKVLEVLCGPAVWSLRCDQYLKQKGLKNVSFTGVDIAPLAPDLTKYGVNWRFVLHDIRKPPLPFAEEFDLIMVNDGTMALPSAKDVKTNPLTTLKKYLKPGGCIEVIETDYVFRCLQPEPATAHGTNSKDAEQARKTATYTVGPATPFSKAQNRFFTDYNKWVEKALQEWDFTVTPCAVMSFGLSTERIGYEEVGSRRVAIPFSYIRWETDLESEFPMETDHRPEGKQTSRSKGLTKGSNPTKYAQPLTSDQAALRQTALNIAVGLIECLEPLLMKESGKKQDEWDRWWSAMMTDLFERNGTINGECLEAGVWWARKAGEDEESETDSDQEE